MFLWSAGEPPGRHGALEHRQATQKLLAQQTDIWRRQGDACLYRLCLHVQQYRILNRHFSIYVMMNSINALCKKPRRLDIDTKIYLH